VSLSSATQLEFSISKVKDLIERISAAIGVRQTTRCALYSSFEAHYRAHYPVSTTLTVSPVKSNEIPVFYFQGQRSNRTYFRCYWVYVDNSMRVILRIWSVIRRTSYDLRFVYCVPSQMQCNYIFQFQGQRSNRTSCRCYWVYVDNSMRIILRIWSFYTARHPVSTIFTVSQSTAVQLQFSIFKVKDLIERISVAIVFM
jgi:hypothetical protein